MKDCLHTHRVLGGSLRSSEILRSQCVGDSQLQWKICMTGPGWTVTCNVTPLELDMFFLAKSNISIEIRFQKD